MSKRGNERCHCVENLQVTSRVTENTKIQKHKNTKTQKHKKKQKNTKTQKHKKHKNTQKQKTQ